MIDDGDEFDPLSLHPTDHCVKWGCEKAKLVRQGRFWICPNCHNSYGENPHSRLKEKRRRFHARYSGGPSKLKALVQGCAAVKCGEYNMLRCARPSGHTGEHNYVIDHENDYPWRKKA